MEHPRALHNFEIFASWTAPSRLTRNHRTHVFMLFDWQTLLCRMYQESIQDRLTNNPEGCRHHKIDHLELDRRVPVPNKTNGLCWLKSQSSNSGHRILPNTRQTFFDTMTGKRKGESNQCRWWASKRLVFLLEIILKRKVNHRSLLTPARSCPMTNRVSPLSPGPSSQQILNVCWHIWLPYEDLSF